MATKTRTRVAHTTRRNVQLFSCEGGCSGMLSPGSTLEEPLISSLENCSGFLGMLPDTFASCFFSSFLESLIYRLDLPLAWAFNTLEAIGRFVYNRHNRLMLLLLCRLALSSAPRLLNSSSSTTTTSGAGRVSGSVPQAARVSNTNTNAQIAAHSIHVNFPIRQDEEWPAAQARTPDYLAGTYMASFSALRGLTFITLLAAFAL